MPYIKVDTENNTDINLYYEDHGSGQPIILIHGYPLSGRAWEKQLPDLIISGYRVITYDRRGFGQSSQPITSYDYDTFAKDLHTLVSHLNLKNFVLVGHSMGGGEVARYLGTYGTKQVLKAVIISGIPPYLVKASDNPEGVDGAVFEKIKKAVTADRPAYLLEFCNQFYNFDKLNGKLVSKQVVDASWLISVGASPWAAINCVQTWGTDFRQDIAKIDIPVLVIQGDSDRIVPLENSGQRLPKLIKNCKLVLIKNGPHGIAWTHAEEVNTALLDFLGSKN